MLELERRLVQKLRDLHVHIAVPDGDTVVLHGMPLNQDFFSKALTNVLFKRPHAHLPFVVGVDEDLQYVGGDLLVNRAFEGGIPRDGWRVLLLQPRPQADLQRVVEDTLALLGVDRPAPVAELPAAQRLKASGDESFLDATAADLTACVADPDLEPTIGRADEADDVVSCVWRWGQTRLPLVLGAHGVGKTNLLYAVARRLRDAHPECRLLSLDLGALFAGTMFEAERESLFGGVLKEAAARSHELALAFEHFEAVFAEVPHGAPLLVRYLDAGAKLIATSLPQAIAAGRLGALERRLDVVDLAELSPEESLDVLRALRPRIETHHRVEIEEACLRPCVEAAYQRLPGCLPAKAITLLDAAAARSSLAGSPVLGMDDLLGALSRCGGA